MQPGRQWMKCIDKGLIIREKWLNKILNEADPKDWEIRGGPTALRGRIYLIQSKSGMIVGECDLIDCIGPMDEMELIKSKDHHKITNIDLIRYKEPYAWVFANAKRYEQPIPYTHPQGAVIWVNIPKEGVEKP